MTSEIEAMAFVADELDPLYRPARFLLGYMHLARGDAANAERAFERLTHPDRASVKQAVSELRAVWLKGPRLARIARKLPVINRWVQHWRDTLPYVIGGDLVLASEVWADMRREWEDSKIPRDSSVTLLRSALRDFGGDKTIDAAVATAPSAAQDEARAFLDGLLDASRIANFDIDLMLLSNHVLMVSSVFTPADEANAEWLQEVENAVAKLRGEKLARLFTGGLAGLDSAVHAKDWKRCRAIVRDLRLYTIAPSDVHVASLLDDPSLDGLGATLAGFFLPALRELRGRRRALQQSLYTESVYHLALAELLSGAPAKLKRARRRASELRTHRLPTRGGSGPPADLRLLTLCLELNCHAMLLAAHDEAAVRPDGKPAADDALDRWTPNNSWWDARQARPELEGAVRHRGRPPEVLAAVHTALGLAERIERWHDDERRNRERRWQRRPWDVGGRSVFSEAGHFRDALQLRETATTHCYRAESLLDMGREEPDTLPYAREEARAHVQRALQLSPLHPLARRLAADARLDETRPPVPGR